MTNGPFAESPLDGRMEWVLPVTAGWNTFILKALFCTGIKEIERLIKILLCRQAFSQIWPWCDLDLFSRSFKGHEIVPQPYTITVPNMKSLSQNLQKLRKFKTIIKKKNQKTIFFLIFDEYCSKFNQLETLLWSIPLQIFSKIERTVNILFRRQAFSYFDL